MCDPVTLTLAATAMAVAGQGVSTMAAVKQANYESKIAERNASLERTAAKDALERGRLGDKRFQEQLGQTMGQQNAALAANGIDINFGSAANVRGDAAAIGQEDALTLRENAMRQVRGLEINASNYTAQARAARSAAKGAAISGILQMGSTALGGAQQFKRTSFQRQGSASF